MEPFEQIRVSAARLHAQLVAKGADPLKPLEIVDAAIRELELELAWLPKGHPALKGARGLFDDQGGAVLCEASPDAGDRAQLAAHEIGHASIHAGSSSCTAHDIDASRSTEAAPVGLQKVEDYGARERRELQANVFARELLLPRAFVRQLHVHDGQTTEAIIGRTGLSKNLVRQQLFDALLLPPIPEETARVQARPARVDPSQDIAVEHRGSAFQLQAGPGTGKTRTLEKRVRSLLDQDVDPASILALTFSNRAAGEVATRLNAAMPEAAPLIWVGTFHAFGLDLVRRYHDLLGLSADPPLFDRSDAIEVLEEILPTLPLIHYRNLRDPAMVLREIVAAISRAKDEMTGPLRYRELAQAMQDAARDEDERVAAAKCLEVARVYELYEQAIREADAVDFGDLIMRPALLLESNSNIRQAVQLRHRHVLVDEYQDVNRASGRLLKAIAGDGKRLWVVGDARQSIYRFRGASSNNMTAFLHEYEGAVAKQLGVNYRSTQQIVDTVSVVAPHMGASKGMLPLTFTSDCGNGPGKPEIRRFESLDEEAEGIAASIRELETAGVGFRNQAVLCRSNRRLNEIAEVLEARGIPVLHLGSLFEREEVRDLLALLSLAVDRFGDGLARVGAMPRYGLSLQDVYLATRRLRVVEGRALSSLGGLSETPGLSEQGARGLTLLANDLEGLAVSSSAWEFLAHYLLDRSGLLRDMAGRESVVDVMRRVALWQFLNFVRERSPAGSGLPIQRTLDRVRQLVLLAEERDLRQVPARALHIDAVRLMTVHGSKGLEFEGVHIPGLTVMSFPVSNRGQRCPPPKGMIEGAEALTVAEEARLSQEHEEQCLFFVACSRARTHLRLYLSKRQPNGNKRAASEFLDWLPAGLVKEVLAPATLKPPGAAQKSSKISVSSRVLSAVSDGQFGLYKKCPRRFFYTHILGLGNAKKPTAFTRTHDCIQKLMIWLAEARRTGPPTVAEAEAEFEKIWAERGPVKHGFAPEYRRLASRLITALINAGAGRHFRNAEPLAIDFPNGRVLVKPNELAQLPNGTIVLRRVATGKKRKDEHDRLEYTLYQLACEKHFPNGFTVEALHLTDESIETVIITAQKLKNRRATSDEMLSGIAAGLFPLEIDPVSCPRCPHFFICGAVPQGPLIVPAE
jgi:superfamily I DNA/RNA helicase/Zn-dependent peptidase ImmA (M78 family)